MEIQPEKIYVAIGKDVQEGLVTLEWAFRKWFPQPISIVLLHFSSSSKDFVKTPFGKLPTSSVCDEKLEALWMCEQEKTDKMLAKYMAVCGKVKVEILKIEKSEESLPKVIVGLISKFHITKLVMDIALTKSSSWKSKSAISGSFYVHKHTPEFCELFIICGGKVILLKEENQGHIEDEQRDMWKKMKEKGYPLQTVSQVSNTNSSETSNSSENCAKEIENYIEWLSTLTLDEEEDGRSPEEKSDSENTDPNMFQRNSDKIEVLRTKIKEAHKTAENERIKAHANMERRKKAEWAISLCNQRIEELEADSKEEVAKQIDLKKDLDTARGQVEDVTNDIIESKNRLKSVSELEAELVNKLHASSSETLRINAELENVVTARVEMLRSIEEIRRQRDMFRRRIDFFREREATATSTDLNYSYREFTSDELRAATDNFSERVVVHVGSNSTVYKGNLNHIMVAIKIDGSFGSQSQDEFQAKMELLCQIRHPHVVTMIGASPEAKAIVFEYMQSGSLEELLFPTTTTTKTNPNPNPNPRTRTHILPWHARIRIAAEICSALGFLHATDPIPTVHGNLKPSNVLLDSNFVAKITDFRLDCRYVEPLDMESDVRDLGILMLQLLTGRRGVWLVEEVKRAMNGGSLMAVLDDAAGEWPSDLAVEFAAVAMECVHVTGRWGAELRTVVVMTALDELRKKAEKGIGGEERKEEFDEEKVESCDLPGVFLCPIFKEVMKDPHIAADGFSYEREAIEEWLGSGHETSPMTNLKLKNKLLTPNHTLRSLINDWYSRSR